MPEVADKIRALVGADNFDSLEGQLEGGNTLAGKALGEKTILFPRPEKK
jgi:hypothetical protein